ncbi:sigma factor-like helix-turn-helix DNA-binding protein, partial [Candidatus Poribacteria bacterium]
VWEAVDELAEDCREAVTLYYISGYSYKEISAMLSVPVSTVQGRLQQARNQLRKEFLDMVTKLQLEIDSTVHKFLREHAKQDGVSVEGLIIRLIERYRRDAGATGAITRQIWDNAKDFEGTVSPDRRYLSYIDWDTSNLVIHDFETGENRDVTDEGAEGKEWQFPDFSIWSPDSKQIAYLWFSTKGCSLRIVGIDGSKPRVLCSSSTKSEYLFPQAWSRDGKHILAIHYREEGETHDIVLVSVADASIRVLKSLDWRLRAYRMSLSPDGRYVVYDYLQNEDSPNRDIFLLATDGSLEMTLVEHPANNFAPFWAPDGKRIVFASDRSGSVGIWVLEVIDGEPRGYPQLIKQNLNGMWPLGLTQDGSYYYGLTSGEGDVYVATLDPETGEVVIPPAKTVQSFEGFNSRPDFSPDGKYLVYVSPRPRGSGYLMIDIRRALVIRSLETGEERVLSPKLMSFGHFACWFPDGRSILVHADGPEPPRKRLPGFYQIDAETGAATPIALSDEQGHIPAITPVWSPDGSKIFFKRGRSIRIYDFETEREWKPDFRLTCGEGYGAGLALSPDGQQLAFMVSCDDEWSLQIAPSSGGDTRETARLRKEETAWGWGLTWTPDGRHLLFLGNSKNGLCELWRISVEGGESQNLGLMIKWHLGVHLSFHPDGRRVAFTGPGSGPGDEVWAMENFLPGLTADK